jgi:uncharacterized membrane protein YeiB
MQTRIIGFDLARAYAILGMFIVNFNFCFGTFGNTTLLGKFIDLFVGNSTAIFIISAGMGVALMTNREQYSNSEKAKLKSIILKRSWFLFALGLLLYSWWPGDILHFYGSYMHIAAFVLFVNKRYYLWIAGLAIVIFHVLLLLIPINTSLNLQTFQYTDFWTPIGFLRNTLYNGWNSFFPWVAYFMLGMWLGKLNWQAKNTKISIFCVGFVNFMLFQGLRFFAKKQFFTEYWTNYIMSEYFPAYLPFMVLTASFALMVISLLMFIGEKFSNTKIVQYLAKTGQMTLTHYVIHITIGMLVLEQITGKTYTGLLEDELPTPPIYILGFAIGLFIFSVIFSVIWSKKYKNGLLETLMRKISQ